MSTVRTVFAGVSLMGLIGGAACIPIGFDDLSHIPSTATFTSTTTTELSASASSPSTTMGMGDTTMLTSVGPDPTTGTTADPLMTDPQMTEASTTATTSASASTCGTDGCGSGTSTSDGPAETTEDMSTGCMVDCTPRRVFVTGGLYPGNFAVGMDAFVAADEICMADAMLKDVTGEFKAWISVIGGDSPSTRFDTNFGGDYVLAPLLVDPEPTPIVIASGWNGLTDGTLFEAINVKANGAEVEEAVSVWTGTSIDGTPFGGSCGAWDLTMGVGTTGTYTEFDFDWTNGGTGMCNGLRRIYCFEDPL